MSLLTVRDLVMTARSGNSETKILDHVALELKEGTITGVAGASGSGKTMTGMAVMGLIPDNTRISGSIKYGEHELVGMPRKAHNALRGVDLAMIFQDASSALHPMLSIERQMTDHARHHQKLSKREARGRAIELLERTRVPNPREALRKYPHQFSGGQLQRIGIASALMCSPKVVIADEPTTALDVTVQAGILRLLRELCDEFGLGVMLVTHDFGVLSSIADEVVVMDKGVVVETGDRYDVIVNPQHPYTRSLIESLPTAETERS